MIKAGDTVKFKALPPWADELPEESRKVFQFCLGRSYKVSEIDSKGLFVLDVSKDIDHRFGGFMNDIRLEEEYLEKKPLRKVRPTSRSSGRQPRNGRRS